MNEHATRESPAPQDRPLTPAEMRAIASAGRRAHGAVLRVVAARNAADRDAAAWTVSDMLRAAEGLERSDRAVGVNRPWRALAARLRNVVAAPRARKGAR